MNAPNSKFQSMLGDYFDRFLNHKRAIGRHFKVEEKTLCLLDRFLADHEVNQLDTIAPELVDEFLASRPRSTPRSYNHLLGTVRRFFDWLVSQDILSTSPVAGKPRRQVKCRIPFIFDKTTAKRLLLSACNLKDNPHAQMAGQTYHTMFALLYGLGLRVGELCRLSDQDIDFDRHLLVVRRTKFNKDRLVPFGPQIADLLGTYMKERHAFRQELNATSPLFSFTRNRPVNPGTVSQTFQRLVPELEFQITDGMAPPVLHDLRHSFAVGTLLRWYRDGIDPGTRLHHLSTFLGHVSPESSAVYLTITKDLLRAAGERFEQFVTPLIKEDK